MTGHLSPGDIAAGIDRRLREAGTAERAEHERAYLKSDLVHYGASVPKIRAAVKAVCRDHHEIRHAQLRAVVDDLWQRRVHECRMAAVELLVCFEDRLRPDDLDRIEQLLREARTWALVDPLAINVVGGLLERHPDEVAPRLDRWAHDDDFWLRRTALLAHLRGLRRGAGDFPRFTRYADAMLDEREFFIRKAIGWVLREAGRGQPAAVASWLAGRIDRASGVTVREAVKHLPSADRDRLRAASAAARDRSS